jgi:hypothetical protein
MEQSDEPRPLRPRLITGDRRLAWPGVALRRLATGITRRGPRQCMRFQAFGSDAGTAARNGTPHPPSPQ